MSFKVWLGIEISPKGVRAVCVRGGLRPHVETVEIELESADESPADVVAALKNRFGSVAAVAVAVDLDLLMVKRVQLPPIPLAERRRVLTLDPERFFPVRGEELAVAVREDDLVFAAQGRLLDAWLLALESIGPVERVEAAPVALARCLVREDLTDGWVLVGGTNGHSAGLLQFVDGRLESARKVLGGPVEAASSLAEADIRPGILYLSPWSEQTGSEVSARLGGAETKPLPSSAGVTATYASALGAVLGLNEHRDHGLATAALEGRVTRRRRRRTAVAALALAASFALAVSALDASRSRTVARLDQDVAGLRDRVSAVLDLQAEMEALARESGALAAVTTQRVNPLRILQIISSLLPSDAHLRAVRGTAADWQLDGYARDAAQLIRLFEASPEFEGVHFRSATSRARIGNETYEAFSLALRYVPAP
jgi:Tfp pilus assembly protein PilN